LFFALETCLTRISGPYVDPAYSTGRFQTEIQVPSVTGSGAEIEAVRAALIEGEKSGKPKRFDASACKGKLCRARVPDLSSRLRKCSAISLNQRRRAKNATIALSFKAMSEVHKALAQFSRGKVSSPPDGA
jgi:hypothetical protein